MKNIVIILLLLSLSEAYCLIKQDTNSSPKALKLNFDFLVKIGDNEFNKEYSGNAIVENREEVVFSYNNKISNNLDDKKTPIKITIKPFLTRKNSHFLVKYYKKERNSFNIISRSLVRIIPQNESKIQIIDGDKFYKLLINSESIYR